MSFFDTHCHPQFPQYDRDRDEVIKRALNEGINMICVGTDLQMSKSALGLANKYAGIWASVGVHPNEIVNWQLATGDWQEIEKLLTNEKVVAVGEIGLDYYRTTDKVLREKQKEALKQFIKLALTYHKPLIFHCRNSPTDSAQSAHEDMLYILAMSYKPLASSSPGVIHSFSASWDIAQRYLGLGLYIGLNGIITFSRDYDETVIKAPLERILLETDAPYLAPIPHRGTKNEPAYLLYIAEKIAELKNTTVSDIAQQTTKNTKQLFRL